MEDLKQKAVRGGVAKAFSQALNFTIRLGSLMLMARILDPKDFGLVGMVTALVGVFNVFKDFGLSAAAVQRKTITEEHSSTLFWINLLAGASLTLITAALAPVVVSFYREPRLLKLTIAIGTGFLFNAAGVQHTALLERQMRFVTLSMIEITSLVMVTFIGVSMAMRGWGYWALAAGTVITPLANTIAAWLATGWIPARPKSTSGIRSMLQFGCTATLNGVVMYAASNMEKVLLGRFWGVEAIGIYGRAAQLVNIPTDNLNSTAGAVAFAALSRLQDQPQRFRSFFLKAYSLVLCLTVPIAFACGAFGNDAIAVFLGAKWHSAAPLFSLLAPTTLAFAILNPLGWLLTSLGLVSRALKIALVLAPAMIGSYVVGLPHGPKGVAIAYSCVLVVSTVPIVCWAVHGTVISLGDVLLTVSRPLLAGALSTAIAWVFQFATLSNFSPLVRLALETAVLFATYAVTMLYIMGQKTLYLDLLRSFRRSSDTEEGGFRIA